MRINSLPKSCKSVILLTFIGAMITGYFAFMSGANWEEGSWVHGPDFIWWICLAALVCSALELVQIELTAEKGRMSLSFAGLLGVVMLLGPFGAAVVGLVEGATGNFVRHDRKTHKQRLSWPDPVKLLFNTFNHSISAAAAGIAYHWAEGRVLVTPGKLLEVEYSDIPAALLATAVFFALNTLGTAAVVATSKGMSTYRVWHENFLWTAPQSLMSASSVVAGLWLLTREHGNAWIAALVLPPIYVVYYSYRLYMDKIRKDLEHISALNSLNNSIISSLATAIDAKDHYTNKHLSRVQTYALAMSEYLGLPNNEHEAVRCAALVHDIGKLGVPEHILTKPGKLTKDEYERMKMHVEIGAAILRPVNFPWPVVEVMLGHHERWDGLGYPNGLKGEDIPIGGRIIALADVFDALTSDRPYRKAMTYDEALAYVRKHSGTHFDPKVVKALMAVREDCEKRIAEMADGDPQDITSVIHPHKISNEVMEQIARANSEFFAMYDVSQSLHGTQSLEGSLKAVIEKIRKLVPFDTCAIFLENGDNELTVEAVDGFYSDLLLGMRVASGEGLSGRVFESLEPIVNAPATNDVGRKIPHTETLELNASLVVPLRANRKTLGTISVYHSSYSIYSEDHARLLTLIAEHAANNIESARRLQESEEMALTDMLTGLPNARMLNNTLTSHLEQALKNHEGFALVLIDLDNFKAVNDTLGHLKGDEVLRIAATAMHSCVRSNDLLARYAGDEFILVVPNADPEHMVNVCKRVAAAVSRITVNDRIRLGASMGFALYPDDGLNARDLIQIADSRMYDDKNRRKLKTEYDGSRE